MKLVQQNRGLKNAEPAGGSRHRFPAAVVALYLIVSSAAPYMYGAFLAPLLFLALVALLLSRVRIPVAAVIWTLALCGLGVFSTLHGLFMDNPGAWPMTSVFVYEPLVLAPLFAGLLAEPFSRAAIYRGLDFALFSVAGLGVAIYISAGFGWELPTWLVDERLRKADIGGDVLRSNYQGYNALVFLAPYGLVRGLFGLTAKREWAMRLLLLVSSMSGILLSGRRILYIVVPVAVAVAVVLLIRRRRASRSADAHVPRVRLTAIVLAGAGMVWIFDAIGLGIFEGLRRVLGQVTLDGQTDIRAVEHVVLLEFWESSPIFGHGSGAVPSGFVRDQASPWAYELTYHSLLMWMGLFGTAVLAVWAGWTLWRLLTAQGFTVETAAVMAGLVGAILASVTNPYLLKLEGIWMVLLPFGLAVNLAKRLGDGR